MDPTAFLTSLGLPGIIILGLAWWGRGQQQRVNELTDKLIEKNERDVADRVAMQTTLAQLVDLIKAGRVA